MRPIRARHNKVSINFHDKNYIFVADGTLCVRVYVTATEAIGNYMQLHKNIH